MHSSHSIDDISGNYCWCIKNQAYYSESFTVSNFYWWTFQHFPEGVLWDTGTQWPLFSPTLRTKFADLEKVTGKCGRQETHVSKFDFSKVKETGNLAQASTLQVRGCQRFSFSTAHQLPNLVMRCCSGSPYRGSVLSSVKCPSLAQIGTIPLKFFPLEDLPVHWLKCWNV